MVCAIVAVTVKLKHLPMAAVFGSFPTVLVNGKNLIFGICHSTGAISELT